MIAPPGGQHDARRAASSPGSRTRPPPTPAIAIASRPGPPPPLAPSCMPVGGSRPGPLARSHFKSPGPLPARPLALAGGGRSWSARAPPACSHLDPVHVPPNPSPPPPSCPLASARSRVTPLLARLALQPPQPAAAVPDGRRRTDRCASPSKVAAVAAVASPNRAAAPPRCRCFAQQGGGAPRSPRGRRRPGPRLSRC